MQKNADNQNKKLNLIIGSITIVFLALFAFALTLSMRKDLLDTRDNYYIITYYSNIGLLEAGAPVKYGGVNIGRVVSVELIHDMRIKVECELVTSKSIPSDSKLAVAATTVSGDTFLNLIVGNAPTNISHSDNPDDAPVLKGLNFISISNIGSIFTDMKDVTSIFTNSLTRLFGKDSYTLQQYKEAIKRLPQLKDEFKLLNEEKKILSGNISKVQSEIKSIKEYISCCFDDLFKKYPVKKIKSNFITISSSISKLSKTIKTIQDNNELTTIRNNISHLNNWADSLKITENSVLGIILSKDCGGISKTIKMVGNSVKTAQDFSLFKKLGFYLDGKRLLENFENRTHAQYLPASVYMYRWSVFSYQRYLHNCDLPCGEKSCPSSLK